MSAPVDEDVVEPELENEGLEMLLHLQIGVLAFLPREDVKGLYRPTVHFEDLQSGDAVQRNQDCAGCMVGVCVREVGWRSEEGKANKSRRA